MTENFLPHDSLNHFIVSVQLCFGIFVMVGLVSLKLLRPQLDRGTEGLVYGTCLFLCALCSYLYTTRFPVFPVALLRQFDHAAIFLLIAGTYTPFATLDIRGPFKIRLLHWIWGMAFTGIILRLILTTGHDLIFVFLYVAMGWIFLTALRDVVRHISRFSLIFLAGGAVVYTTGATLFALNLTIWTDPIWHGCVLVAAMLHFTAIAHVLNGAHAHVKKAANRQGPLKQGGSIGR